MSEAVLAKQADILRANKMGKLRQRRGGLDSSFAAMQDALATTEKSLAHVNTRVSKSTARLRGVHMHLQGDAVPA
jgi:protoporphyrinogen oxidase